MAVAKKSFDGNLVPGCGWRCSWRPAVDEEAIVRAVIVALEDKRALYEDYDREIRIEVNQSLMNIRALLTDAIGKLGENSPAVPAFKIMRAACRLNLIQTPLIGRPIRRLHIPAPGAEGPAWSESIESTADNFFVALGKLRGIFGQQLAHLAYLYQIDLEGQLVSILPPEPASDDQVRRSEQQEPDKARHWTRQMLHQRSSRSKTEAAE